MYVAHLYHSVEKFGDWRIDLYNTENTSKIRVDKAFMSDCLKAKTFKVLLNNQQVIYDEGYLTEQVVTKFCDTVEREVNSLARLTSQMTKFKFLMRIDNRFSVYCYLDFVEDKNWLGHTIVVVDNLTKQFYQHSYVDTYKFFPKTCAYSIEDGVLSLRLLSHTNKVLKNVAFIIGG